MSSHAVTAAATAPGRPGRRMTPVRAWTITLLLAIFLFFNYSDKALIGLAGTHIQHDLGLSAQQFGVIQSGFYWLFAAGALLLGALSSRIKLRWYLAALMLVWVSTMIPLLGVIGFGTLLACRVILGFAVGPAYALANHSVQLLFPAEKRALASGVVTAGSSLGPLVMAPVLSWIIVQWSWHTGFAVLAVGGIAWALAWLVFGGSAHDDGGTGEPAALSPRAAARAAKRAQKKAAIAATVPAHVPYRVLLGTSTVIGVALLNFFSYWSTSLKVAWLPVYLADGLGYDTITVGRLVALPFATAAVFSILAGWVSNRLYARGFSRRVSRGYLAGGLVAGSGLAMWGFTLVPVGWFQLTLVALAFSLNTASIGVGFAALGDMINPKKRGGIMGGIVALSSLAGIVSPLVLGFTVGGASSSPSAGYDAGFAVIGLMIAGGAILATIFIRPDKDLDRVNAWAARHGELGAKGDGKAVATTAADAAATEDD
ncbi:MFS transporter [Microbacterium sp. ASV81]|uniref:MFS transporter n=1 Tax=Microbacterium capsulatum TaxID=3041921 RepID=A0ABU0XH91_9MICO|nr:MFS transporter [Microbacterium sp. ASV81]MDQ4214494.1 MFS transporter [Microbacterium sp. ASV81]